jgi:hypothetical protein
MDGNVFKSWLIARFCVHLHPRENAKNGPHRATDPYCQLPAISTAARIGLVACDSRLADFYFALIRWI